MANKSAASAKVKKIPMHAQNKINTEEYFEDAIEGLVLIIETAQRNCDRIDNLVDTYNEMRRWGLIDVDDIHAAQVVCDHMKDDYENVLEVVKDLRYNDFTKKEMDDPILPLIPKREGILDLAIMYDAYTTWRVLRPIGEKIEQLHDLIYREVTNDVPF